MQLWKILDTQFNKALDSSRKFYNQGRNQIFIPTVTCGVSLRFSLPKSTYPNNEILLHNHFIAKANSH